MLMIGFVEYKRKKPQYKNGIILYYWKACGLWLHVFLFYSVVHDVLEKNKFEQIYRERNVAEKVSVAKIKMEYIYIIYKKENYIYIDKMKCPTIISDCIS